MLGKNEQHSPHDSGPQQQFTCEMQHLHIFTPNDKQIKMKEMVHKEKMTVFEIDLFLKVELLQSKTFADKNTSE